MGVSVYFCTKPSLSEQLWKVFITDTEGVSVALYNGSLTREQFMFREMRIVAKLYREGLVEREITDRVFRGNLFQYPTEREIKGKCRVVLKRLACIAHSDELVEFLADGNVSEAKQAALVAMMCQSRLLAEFMIEVVGEKYRSLDLTLTQKDLNVFFANLCEKDEAVAGWSVSTVKRIKSVLMNILRETGYLEGIGSEILCPVLISDEFERAIKDAGLYSLLPAFNKL